MGLHGMNVRPLSTNFGAEIHGVDLAQPLDDDTLLALRKAHAQYGVIFFRDQDLTPEQHVAFAQRWGEINVNRFFQPVDGHPLIAEVRKEPDQKFNIGGGWHADHSYDLVPAMGSILYAREVPEVGGDTMFADMASAYDTLSSGLKKTLASLQAIHSSRHIFGAAGAASGKAQPDLRGRIGNAESATQDVVHPVVIQHPDSGRPVLYVNPGFTVKLDGWSSGESQALLRHLYDHATRPERTIRFQWQKGSIAFWDNRATWHYALNDYHGQRRLMHRITLEGVPVAAA